tara:strand:- start:1273 stop:1467 length:195 start_codon:yes stop_codon:yes gene_type:complete
MKKHKYKTVEVELTNPEDNIHDVANLLALMAFTNDYTETEIKALFAAVVEDQYFQAIINSNETV